MSLEKIVEAAIQEAMLRGDFDNLPGKGKPVDLSDYFNTPEDVRVAQAMLKNAGMIPVELELLQEIATLKESLASSGTIELEKTRKLLVEKQLELNLLLERRKRTNK